MRRNINENHQFLRNLVFVWMIFFWHSPLSSIHMHRYDTLSWARKLYIQPQAMAHDRYLYDPTTNEWTVDRYLADLNTRYGGIDAILLCVLHAKMNSPSSYVFLLVVHLRANVSQHWSG